jgi:hypothetical protein
MHSSSFAPTLNARYRALTGYLTDLHEARDDKRPELRHRGVGGKSWAAENSTLRWLLRAAGGQTRARLDVRGKDWLNVVAERIEAVIAQFQAELIFALGVKTPVTSMASGEGWVLL